ncbi:hypothetical protein SNE35_10205 [Paucibacter sp. R3-3]|uniref:Lipoprotein n=1 Tax=Roseateles agri TaxID=3098619 RepID=A0ABU5DF53_9BURK|nr:hypothetical protein [Paucibacter sp. R3-3]MDY0744881.1 hypothetical protein [Paucibacter sp. R3-3]
MVTTAMLMTGCGGGGDIGEPLLDGYTCALNNCKESNTVSTDNVSPRFTITQVSGKVHVDAWLGQSANLLTTLMPSPGDSLTASDGDVPPVALRDASGNRLSWVTDFSDASAQPRITVNFVRNGQTYPNVVTMPKPFSIVSPTGVPQIRRSTGQFDVKLASENLQSVGLAVDANCTRSDRSNFTSKGVGLNRQQDTTDASTFHISTLALDKALNDASVAANKNDPLTSPVASCSLTLNWVITVEGTVAPTLNQHGWIVATRSVGLAASYDAGS